MSQHPTKYYSFSTGELALPSSMTFADIYRPSFIEDDETIEDLNYDPPKQHPVDMSRTATFMAAQYAIAQIHGELTKRISSRVLDRYRNITFSPERLFFFVPLREKKSMDRGYNFVYAHQQKCQTLLLELGQNQRPHCQYDDVLMPCAGYRLHLCRFEQQTQSECPLYRFDWDAYTSRYRARLTAHGRFDKGEGERDRPSILRRLARGMDYLKRMVAKMPF